MADAIRREFNNADGWVARIPNKYRKKFNERLKNAKKANNQVDPLHMTLFSDKISIISAAPYFAGSKEQFETDLNELRDLRNNLAHATNTRRIADRPKTYARWSERRKCGFNN